MNTNVPSIIKKYLGFSRYVNLLKSTGQSLRTQGLRKTRRRIVDKVQRKFGLASPAALELRHLMGDPSPEAIADQADWSAKPGYRPTMHLALPASGQSIKCLRKTVQSVKSQTYPHWVLKILCPSHANPKVLKTLQRLKRTDGRIQLIPVDSERPSQQLLNTAIDNTEESYFGSIQEGDTLRFDALFHVAQNLEHNPRLDVIYTDESHIPMNGKYPEHIMLKPDWSPEMLLGYNYLGSLCMVRQTVLHELGGFHPAYQEAQEWDLALRLMESGCHFKRVPHCCYFRRTDNANIPHGTATEPTSAHYRAALKSHLNRQELEAEVESQDNGVQRIRWNLSEEPRVSVIIPNKNSPELIQSLFDDLQNNTDYSDIEIIIVDNLSTDSIVRKFYSEQMEAGQIKVVPFDKEFNYSAACNAGVRVATGELLLFLNNDMRVRNPGWLTELVGWSLRPEVGIVGSKLIYPNGHIQHVGVVLGLHFATHIYHKATPSEWGVMGTINSYKNYMAVTGACQMVRRELFNDLGGYDENYRLVGSDIALCLKARQQGFRTVYTPYASLVHYEEYSRGRSIPIEDMERLASEIRDIKLHEDPYLHPNLNAKEFQPCLRGPRDIAPKEMLQQQLDSYNPTADQLTKIDWFDDEAIRDELAELDVSFAPPTYSPSRVAEDVNAAAGFILHVLRKRNDIRKRFPLALSEGKHGAFCKWLCSEGLEQFRVPTHAGKTIRAAFDQHPGLKICQLYGFRPDLRAAYPAAFLPTGHRAFLHWLLIKGRQEYQFRDEEIWWFFLEAAEDPAREFEFTYHIQQDWQRNFPAASTAFGRDRILSWLKRRHRLDNQVIEDIQSRTNTITIEDIRVAYWSLPFWRSKFPSAFREEMATLDLVNWLRTEHCTMPIPEVPLSCSMDQPVHQKLGMNVLAHFCYPSGLQQSAWSLVRSLEMERIPVSLRDIPAHYHMYDF
ncbi:MAG: glycosyltransferase family 2 protein, partial [Planctomycetaceae bacterium]|nr:glycosyltransferase family 2 protein [Planctomycetaceae bacterium]